MPTIQQPLKAFPVPDNFVSAGMSLRDWFAGQAIAGRLVVEGVAIQVAREAYAVADAMLEARKE